MDASGAAAKDVVGLGFDATCSLVCLDRDGAPVGIDPSAAEDDARNVILWADHRANSQASAINALGHPRLATVGGTISPEMEVPKMLWLLENMRAAFDRVNDGGKFLDLADFLAFRATDDAVDVRSLCTVVCKWNYDADARGGGRGWDRTFLRAVGFDDDELPPSSIGSDVQPPGARVPGGLGPTAADELGLDAGVPLAVGIIDAHAGGIGSLGIELPGSPALTERLALIAGTSTCHMASSSDPCFVPGVWGPYYGAMLPGMYLNEGGQSAAGALLDHVISSHAAYPELQSLAAAAAVPVSEALNQRLQQMAEASATSVASLAVDVHVTPDYAGNRSPLADPHMRGAVVGLALSATLDDLAVQYLATVLALAYQTRQIVEALKYEPPIRAVVACGGLSKNSLVMQMHSDVLGLPIYTPKQEEAVLLGAAILGAVAGGAHGSLEDAMATMSAVGGTVNPQPAETAFHERKYQVFQRMNEHQREYRSLMAT